MHLRHYFSNVHRLFTFYIDSTSTRLGRATVDYYSLPLRVLVTGCGGENIDLAATKGWMAETLASYAMPTTDKFTEVCLRASQLIAALRDFLPHTALKQCETRWGQYFPFSISTSLYLLPFTFFTY